MKKYRFSFVAMSAVSALVIFLGGMFSVAPHMFLGIPEAEAFHTGFLYPNTDGAAVEWETSTGTRHFAMVNENGNCDGNATYVYTTSTQIGNKQEYFFDLSQLPAGSIIQRLTFGPCIGTDAATGTSSFQLSYQFSEAGSSTVSGALPVAAVTSSVPMFAGSQSTTSTLNVPLTSLTALSVTASSVNLPNAGIRLSQLSLQVSYSLKTAQLYPVKDGTYMSWTPSNYAGLLDEPVCDTSGFVYTMTATSGYTGVSQSVMFDLSSIPNNSKITSITIQPCASVYSSGVSNGVHNLRISTALTGAATSTSFYGLNTSSTVPQALPSVMKSYSVIKQSTTELHVIFTLTTGNLGAKVSNINVKVEYE